LEGVLARNRMNMSVFVTGENRPRRYGSV
jgi:hypothetical protein